jgi:hypothetical protein
VQTSLLATVRSLHIISLSLSLSLYIYIYIYVVLTLKLQVDEDDFRGFDDSAAPRKAAIYALVRAAQHAAITI